MQQFAALFAELDASTKTTAKVDALVNYFHKAPPSDAAWCISFLMGRKPKQVVRSGLLREWAAEFSQIPLWLFEESYHAVGDLAETIALLLPESDDQDLSGRTLTDWVENLLLPMANLEEPDKKQALLSAWKAMRREERFLWNKLITGAFRVGVSQNLVTKALGIYSGIDPAVLAHRLMGPWIPSPDFFQGLIDADQTDTEPSRLYPFYLAYPLEDSVSSLGSPHDWHAEWKWDGIRSQLIRRQGQIHLWTRGEELVTDRYPDLLTDAMALPDGTVIDGELLPWDFESNLPMSFGLLQKRIGRKNITKKILEEIPVVIVAYDLLEVDSQDIRHLPFAQRRQSLEKLIAETGFPKKRFQVSPEVPFSSWEDLASQRMESRSRMVEGVMIKRSDSPYRVGRKRGDWWKWKIEPLVMDCVMTMAQRGSGRRASLYSDYTFAVWDRPGGSLVTVAKAYSGLTDEEIRQIDTFVRSHTKDRFGPVRAVEPKIVMEIAFEGIQASPRHKSGIAVRFPRIARIRHDKRPEEADTLENLKHFLNKTNT
ncbi:MAG: hypothetical protein RJA81_334 [Planctomycetota bacterium]|jgi:DNA ligase-1